jgi:succinate dehydrogenase / fumarate reductase cytochrome b subunit
VSGAARRLEDVTAMTKPHEYVTYRGGAGQWSWLIHRLTGVGVLVFLLAHIVDTAMIGWGPAAYNKMIELYRLPIFRVSEVLLAGAVLYHALNGVRIIIIDFWPQATLVQRKLFYAVLIVFAVLYVPAAIYMLKWLVQ